jgi:ATP-dependent Clp protease ATP-binding subunit ClpC
MMERFTQQSRRVLLLAQDEAERNNHGSIGTEHLLLAIAREEESTAHKLLNDMGITRERLEAAFADLFPATVEAPDNLDLSRHSKTVLELAVEEVRKQGARAVEPHHLLMGLAHLHEGGAHDLFMRLDIFPDDVYETVTSAIKPATLESARIPAPTLGRLARNKTLEAKNSSGLTIAGRVYHMQRIEQILARRYHKKVLLVGHPGTGKTTIVDAIVDKMVREGRDETVWQASYEDLVGVGMIHDTYNKRLQTLIHELEDSQHILHITDVPHKFAQGFNVLSIMQRLMQADIRLIQECPLDFYEEHLEDDSSVRRHFSTLMVNALPPEDTRTVLIARKAELEAHHEVEFLDSAVEAILEYADEVMPFLYNPDQALRFMDEVGAIVASRDDLTSPIREPTVVRIVNYLTGNSEF